MSYGSMPPPPVNPYGGAAPGGPPQNYLVWAILSTVLCCLPLGVASIVFAAQVNTKWTAGDYAGAQESSRKAKQFAIWSVAAWGIFAVLYVLFLILVALSSN
jgi:hypothetical protein